MATVPNPNNPKIKEYETRVFTQEFFIVEDDGEVKDSAPRKARVEVQADDEGVFIESDDGKAIESLSIPTSDLAIAVSTYILSVYSHPDPPTNSFEEAFSTGVIKFLTPEVQSLVAHELWRLENHITSPHGPVMADGAGELLKHLKSLANALAIKPAPHPPVA